MSKKLKQVISCSRRTDIPACYYEWLQNVLKNNIVTQRNPLFPEKESTKIITPDNTKCIVLWSKDFKNVILNPGYLNEYNLIFNYTITGYSKVLEPNVPLYKDNIVTLEQLCNKYSPEQIRPRFDPIIISKDGEVSPTPKAGIARINQFEIFCKDLNSLGINNVTTSFISSYKHVTERFRKNGFKHIELSDEFQVEFIKRMLSIADKYDIDIYSCSSPLLENVDGIHKAHCIDAELIDKLFPDNGKVSYAKASGQRTACGCYKSVELGGYLPCKHNCLYCYGVTR